MSHVATFFKQHERECVLGHTERPPALLTSSETTKRNHPNDKVHVLLYCHEMSVLALLPVTCFFLCVKTLAVCPSDVCAYLHVEQDVRSHLRFSFTTSCLYVN